MSSTAATDAGTFIEKLLGDLGGDRRKLKLVLRRLQRRERRREVRKENRQLFWNHRSQPYWTPGSPAPAPRPPIQAVRSQGRYLAEFVWDPECDWASCPGELRKRESQAQLERRRGDDEGMARAA
jgi:hypothetical protein